MEKSVDDFIYKLFTATKRDDLNYLFMGDFTDPVTESVLALAESTLSIMPVVSKIKKRVYLILVEGIQNIAKHQEESNKKTQPGFFIIQYKDNNCHISTANIIEDENIDKLVQHINKINDLTLPELKTLYKDVLQHGYLSDKGGAGLGLIDMARKSGSKIKYKFKPNKFNNSHFYMQIILKAEEDAIVKEELSIDNIAEIHQLIAKENISLLFNNLISQESLLYLLSIIERQIVEVPLFRKKVYNTIVEMLQNIIHHGINPEGDQAFIPGIFYVGEENGGYNLYCGNYVSASKADQLKENIEYVNAMDFPDLEDYYNRRLFDFEIDNPKEAGLGIIDIRLKSRSNIDCKLKNINKDLTFFSVKVFINRN